MSASAGLGGHFAFALHISTCTRRNCTRKIFARLRLELCSKAPVYTIGASGVQNETVQAAMAYGKTQEAFPKHNPPEVQQSRRPACYRGFKGLGKQKNPNPARFSRVSPALPKGSSPKGAAKTRGTAELDHGLASPPQVFGFLLTEGFQGSPERQ